MSVRRRWVIGAADTCDIVAASAFVSARHCRLDFDGTTWLVTDLDSTNGTYVNGTKIKSPTPITGDDVVTLGRSFPLPWPATEPRPPSSQPASGDREAPAARSGPLCPGLRLEARHLGVDVGDKRLLDDISLVFSPGQLVGVMGTSGAGKSTLLQALAGASPPTQGAVLVGAVDLYAEGRDACGLVGYVPQDDIMHTDLTVGTALRHAARLRLPPDLPARELDERVAGIMEQLGIASLANARIGSPERRGISGGQRKRVNIALEMITNPPILVLDEPTSGLSSTDAIALVRLLRRLASAGKTIVLTIHQPSAEALGLMDAIAVIARDASTGDRGTLVWHGPPLPDAIAFFEPGSGRDAAPEPDGILRGLQSRPVSQWRAAYLATSTYRTWGVEKPYLDPAPTMTLHEARPRQAGPVRQCGILCRRMVAVKLADAWNTTLLLLQAPVIAVLIAAVFSGKARAHLDEATWTDVSSALGMTTFLLALSAVWFGCSNAAREIVSERAIHRRERMAGLSPAAYVASKAITLSAFGLLQCLVLLAIVIPACGLQGRPSTTFLLTFLAAQAGTSLGLTLSARARTPDVAAAALPLLILPMVILGGILLPLGELPAVLSWMADFMPSRWAFEGLMLDEATPRMTLSVPDATRPGSFVTRDIAAQWFPDPEWRHPRWVPGAILACLWIMGLLAAYFSLEHRPTTGGRRR